MLVVERKKDFINRLRFVYGRTAYSSPKHTTASQIYTDWISHVSGTHGGRNNILKISFCIVNSFTGLVIL